mgnify:CR=1 FL=1
MDEMPDSVYHSTQQEIFQREATQESMNRYRHIILGFVVLACTVGVVAISAGALWEGNSRAQLLSLLFGSFAAGATFANLMRDIRKKK